MPWFQDNNPQSAPSQTPAPQHDGVPKHVGQGLGSTSDSLQPAAVEEVEQEAKIDGELFSPYYPLLRSVYGDSIDKELYGYCYESRRLLAHSSSKGSSTKEKALRRWLAGFIYRSVDRPAHIIGKRYIARLPTDLNKTPLERLFLARIDPEISYLGFYRILLIVTFVAIPLCLISGRFLGAHAHVVASDMLFGLAWFMAGIAVLIAALDFSGTLIRRTLRPKTASGHAFSEVCNLLIVSNYVQQNITKDGRGNETNSQRLVLKMLQTLADSIEVRVPRGLGLKPITSDVQVLRQFKLVARRIRSLRIWIVSPQTTTTESLMRELALIGGAVASGRYHHFLDAGNNKDDEPTPISRVIPFVMRISIGIVVLAAYFIFRDESKISSTLLTLGIAWLVATLASLVPDYRTQLSTMKDVTSLVFK